MSPSDQHLKHLPTELERPQTKAAEASELCIEDISADMNDLQLQSEIRKMSVEGRLQDKYTILESIDRKTRQKVPYLLGQGRTAKVVLAKQNVTDQQVAIKIFDSLQQREKLSLLKELTVTNDPFLNIKQLQVNFI